MNAPAGPTAPTGTPEGLFPHTIGDNTPDPNAPVAPGPAEPSAEDQRFAALEASNAAILAQNAQMMQMLMTQRVPQGPAAPQALQAPAPFSLEGLPDAVAAPKDFMTQLGQRISQREQQQAQYLTHNITQQISRGAAMDGMFNRFTMQHSELAKKNSLLQGAALTEFQALQAQGIDPVSVAQQNPDALITRIAQRMQTELGVQPTAPGAAPAAPTAQPGGLYHGAPLTSYSPPTPAQPSAARVAGLQGGSGMPTPPRAPAPPRGFVDQINDARKRDGLI